MKAAILMMCMCGPVAAEPWFPGAPDAKTESTEFGGITVTTGEVDGKRLRADTTTFGGTTTTTGTLDGKQFICEETEFGGTVTRRCR